MSAGKELNVSIIILIVGCVLIGNNGCKRHSEWRDRLDAAELILKAHPDSALKIIESIPEKAFSSSSDQARYALLHSIALDKNFIDTTSLSIIQPAVNHYLNHGSADEKLKTYYYLGRIHQNRQENDSALMNFMKAIALHREISDSLTLAHALVCAAVENYHQYKITEYADLNIQAARIYDCIGEPLFALKSYTKAIRGNLYLHNKSQADSLLHLCETRYSNLPVWKDQQRLCLVVYGLELGPTENLIPLINESLDRMNDSERLSAAQVYSVNGLIEKADSVFLGIDRNTLGADSLKYFYTQGFILEKKGDYKNAYPALLRYCDEIENRYQNIMADELLFVERKYNIELENLEKIQERDRIIWWVTGSLTVAVIFALWLFTLYKLNYSRRILSEKENINLKIAKDLLEKDKENLILSNKNVELAYRQQLLIAENLRLQLKEVDEERENLKQLLEKNSDFSPEIQDAIKNRIEFLNKIFVKHLPYSNRENKPENWYANLLEDKEAFLNTTRLAFKASHPEFIAFLEEKQLTDVEINFVCLYAIGLNGKEIGEYIQLKRHYHISSAIRKKLGLDSHNTNLSIYIRNLLSKS